MEPISIFNYSDYRLFLRDLLRSRQEQNPNFTFRYMSQKSGVSHSLFQMVLCGKRNLSDKTLDKVIRVFRLSRHEERYFEALVYFNQSDAVEEKNFHFRKMLELQKKSSWYSISNDEMAYLDEWYHPIIRELAVLSDFDGDFEELARRVHPPISAEEAESSVRLLCAIGFLKKQKQGGYVQAEPVLTSHHALNQARIINYQIRFFENAKASLISLDADKRYTSTTTFGISEKTFRQLVARVKGVKEELLELARQDKAPENVYQMLFHLMPVSGRKEGA